MSNGIKTDKKRRLKKALIERDGKVCHYCGRPLQSGVGGYNDEGLSIDHITPVVDGGTDDLENLVLACRRCNLNKRTKHYQEYRLSVETDAALMFIMGAQS